METGAQGSLESNQDKSYIATQRSPEGWQKFWQKELTASNKRVDKFISQGNKVVSRFLDERDDESSRLNLFHTNTTVLLSMLFGVDPKIEVAREHHDPDDDDARVAALILQRILEADNLPSGSDLPTVLRSCLQDRLLPGLGAARVRYDMRTQTMPELVGGEVVETEKLLYEDCPIEYVHWQDFRWGWARTWAEVPWLGYRAYLTKDKVIERFGPEVARKVKYKSQEPKSDAKTDHSSSNTCF